MSIKLRKAAQDVIDARENHGYSPALQAAINALSDALAEPDEVLTALKVVAYTLEKSRIWDGQGWHYNPLHPMIFVPALEKALATIAKAEGQK
jgi:hypothetical protein